MLTVTGAGSCLLFFLFLTFLSKDLIDSGLVYFRAA